MKKGKVFLYILLLIILCAIIYFVIKNINQKDETYVDDKYLSEVKYIESELVNMLNTMNNIETRNYSVYISKLPNTSNQTNESSSNSESDSKDGDSKEQDSSSVGGDSSSEQSSNKSLNGDSSIASDNKSFNMKSNGVLASKNDVNWDIVKTEVENLYLSIPTLTIDVYDKKANEQDVLAFNKDYDSLVITVKDEKKVETLARFKQSL